MSGGSFDYMYSKIRDTYKGELHDQELEEMLEANNLGIKWRRE